MENRWSNYYEATSGRDPRGIFIQGLSGVDASLPKKAIEVGFGAGNEVLFLLDQGWKVQAIDAEQEAADLLLQRVNDDHNLELVIDTYENVEFRESSFIHAGYSLPFCNPDDFPRVWENLMDSILTGGVFCGQLFGVNDAWNDGRQMTFHTADQVENLLFGFDLLHFQETEKLRKTATGGEKYWHIFDIVARKLEPTNKI